MTAPSRAAPTITRAWLEDRDACHDQVATFSAEWPDGVEITREALLRAAGLELDLSWFADHVLSAQTRQAYDVALAQALLTAGAEHGWRGAAVTAPQPGRRQPRQRDHGRDGGALDRADGRRPMTAPSRPTAAHPGARVRAELAFPLRDCAECCCATAPSAAAR
jgi:hypothetical protein